MSKNTPNYNLEKPGTEEFYDVNVPNGNMDKIDSALKTLAEEVASGVTQEDLTAIDTKLDNINQGVGEIKGKSDQIKQDIATVSTQIANKSAGKVLKSQTFYTSASFTVPHGVTEVFITGGGGGGGGGAAVGPQTKSTAGGVTSFGSLLSISGGGRGYDGSDASLVFMGGSAGGKGGSSGGAVGINGKGGDGGNGGWYSGGYGSPTAGNNNYWGGHGAYCSGGGGCGAAGGGAGDFIIKRPLVVTPLTNYAITVGLGGTGSVYVGSGYVTTGGKGGDGILTVEWWQ